MPRPSHVKTQRLEALFRVDVARILRISRSAVNVHLRAGRLRTLPADKIDPQKGPPYDPLSVLELALARSEMTEQDRVRELFEERANVLEIAALLRTTPERVRELYREWRTPLDVDTKRIRDEEKSDEERAAKRRDELDQEWSRRQAERRKRKGVSI